MDLKERIKKVISDHCEGSRKTFADLIQIAPSTIQAWDDEHLPKGDILQRIHKEFGVDITWLLTGEGDPYLTGGAVDIPPEASKGGEYADPPVGLGQAVEQLARILDSDNQPVANTILLFLRFFYESVESQKKDKDRKEQSEEELKKRISALEEKCERLIEEIKRLREGVPDRRKKTIQNTMEFVDKVNDATAESTDIKGNLEKILGHLLDLLKRVDRGAIVLLDTESMEISEIISKSKKPAENITDEFIRPIVELVRQGEAPLLIQNNEDLKLLSPTFELSNIGSLMCVPLFNDESRVRGAFYIDSLDKPYGFRREDLTILTDLSKRAAMIIEHGANAEPHPN
jgi:DNA-binding transcriptional MerR regulator